jgi:hypothetical protein
MSPQLNSKLLTSHLLARALLTLIAVLLFTAALQVIAQQPRRNEQQRGVGLAPAPTEKRVALVMGNSRYEMSPLRNPVNDANLVAVTLREMGFDVIARTDVNLREMQSAVREFSRKIHNGSIGLSYYAGHGMQSGGRNFLIPIGAQIEAEGDVVLEALDLNSVLEQMGQAQNRLNIVILDACRNNPFTRSFRGGSQGINERNQDVEDLYQESMTRIMQVLHDLKLAPLRLTSKTLSIIWRALPQTSALISSGQQSQ